MSVQPVPVSSTPSAPHSSWSCCPSCCPSCSFPSTRRYWDRCISSTLGVKFCSVLIMLECAYIAITGRGVISILQAVVGVIFSIEGYWGAVRFDRPSIKRFLIFLLCFFAAGIVVGIIDTTTITEYCSTASSGSDQSNCTTTYRLYAIVLIIITAATLPIFFLITTLFYLKLLSVHSAQHRRGHHTLGAAGQRGGGPALQGYYKADEDEDLLYWEGQMFDSDDEEEVAYAGRELDEAKADQFKAELAVQRGDKDELHTLERRGSVVVRESPLSGSDEDSKIDVRDNG